MHHLAILNRRWHLAEKILAGEKRIESRWYKSRVAPWGLVREGDTVFFKETGKPVTLRARVRRVEQFADLSPERVRKLLTRHHIELGIGVDKLELFYERFKAKRYCIFIYLEDPERVDSFEISKKGFGNMCAWISVEEIGMIKPMIKAQTAQKAA